MYYHNESIRYDDDSLEYEGRVNDECPRFHSVRKIRIFQQYRITPANLMAC